MASSQISPIGFLKLPEELVCQVLEEMAPEERAVMGLTNKSMTKRLTISANGVDTRPWENLQGDARFRFLCAIEKCKYRRHGLDLAPFFPDLLTGVDSEDEIEHYGSCRTGTSIHLWNVVNKHRLAYNQHGLFWRHRSVHRITRNCGPQRAPLKLPLDAEAGPAEQQPEFGHRRVRYIFPEYICLCGQNVPCFDFGKLLRGDLDWAVCTMPQHLDDGLPVPNARATPDLVQDMLPGGNLVGGRQIGPIVSCGKCRRDFRAQLKYPNGLERPLLIMATWAFLGDGASYASVQTALRTPWENTAPQAAGRVAQMSGMLQLD
ncbi:hypothetical protein PG996_008440 [Apiospora saccharicola]|uniref:F-box domain-containing protein n=1 Tax=Apiospora saccharicola TaxID=335842 RepID=A0ABR1UXY2_9PEZI